MKTTRNLRLVVALVSGLAIGGCGGGHNDGGSFPIGGGSGGNDGNTGDNIPDSALQNSDSFIAYVRQVVASAVDNSEPINLGNAKAPVSDTAEAANL